MTLGGSCLNNLHHIFILRMKIMYIHCNVIHCCNIVRGGFRTFFMREPYIRYKKLTFAVVLRGVVYWRKAGVPGEPHSTWNENDSTV